MWNQTVWPLIPCKQQEKDQPSKHDDALITLLWDHLVSCRPLLSTSCACSLHIFNARHPLCNQGSSQLCVLHVWSRHLFLHASQAKVDYFSPLLWRVDVYGNVLYRFADAGTALSWSVDHLFPVARGGFTKMPNMRIVQSHAHINKADRYSSSSALVSSSVSFVHNFCQKGLQDVLVHMWTS